MKRLFLDANVIFTAAHNPLGKAALVIGLGVDGHWETFASRYALEEARRNLRRKFPRSIAAMEAIIPVLQLSPHGEGWPRLSGLAEKDQPIFQSAMACKATHLLTGDLRDFGRFMNRPSETHGVCIQTVAEFLDEFNA